VPPNGWPWFCAVSRRPSGSPRRSPWPSGPPAAPMPDNFSRSDVEGRRACCPVADSSSHHNASSGVDGIWIGALVHFFQRSTSIPTARNGLDAPEQRPLRRVIRGSAARVGLRTVVDQPARVKPSRRRTRAVGNSIASRYGLADAPGLGQVQRDRVGRAEHPPGALQGVLAQGAGPAH